MIVSKMTTVMSAEDTETIISSTLTESWKVTAHIVRLAVMTMMTERWVPMTIDDLKRALVEVKHECMKHDKPVNGVWCVECPFFRNEYEGCPIAVEPLDWEIDDWEEDASDENAV